MKIYVDAMGGDLAPEAPVKGTLMALRQFPHLTIILAGKLDEVKPFLGDYDDVKDRLILEEEPEVITNHESPVMGVRKKVNSATVQGMLKVRSGEADGFVSAGSTGATLAGGMFRLGRIPGIERPALAPLMPNGKGHFLLIDCGANVDCKPEYLVQFGIMGDAYMRGVMGMENPRIGLVNIGAEAEKGNALVKETYPLMEKAPYNFVGNVEARDVPLDQADVCVTDGFGGNLILKYTEGLASALMGLIKKELMADTRGNKAVRFPAAHLQHALHRGAVHLFAHAHDRAFMIGDHLRLLLQGQPVLHVTGVSEEWLDFLQPAGQDDLQLRIFAQCVQGSLHRSLRRQVPAHRVHINLQTDRSSVSESLHIPVKAARRISTLSRNTSPFRLSCRSRRRFPRSGSLPGRRAYSGRKR